MALTSKFSLIVKAFKALNQKAPTLKTPKWNPRQGLNVWKNNMKQLAQTLRKCSHAMGRRFATYWWDFVSSCVIFWHSAIFCVFRYVCLIFWFESCSCWVALVLQKNTSTRDEKNTKFNLNQNCHRYQKDKWLHFNLPYHRPLTRLRQTLSEGEGESAYGSNILIGCWDSCIQNRLYTLCFIFRRVLWILI